MHALLVVVVLALAFIGYTVERQPPMRFTRGKAVGLVLFVVGEIILFGQGWWWGQIGLAVPAMVIDVVLAATLRR
jgi:hypothetical protein